MIDLSNGAFGFIQEPIRREAIPKRLRFEILKRDAFCCQYCGRRAGPDIEMHLDHVIPVCRGGKSVYLNLVTACSGCNAGKSGGGLSDDETYIFLGRGILCRRLGLEREKQSLQMMTDAVARGFDVGVLLDLCRTAQNWTQFAACINALMQNAATILCENEEHS
jgi:hypothetical protein